MDGQTLPDPDTQVWINGINDTNTIVLMTWVKETKTQLVQINCQRKYGGGSEVFIGPVPKEYYEDKLIPLFQSIARSYEFWLLMNFSGMNRGFACTHYTNRRLPYTAMSALNSLEIRSGSRLFVCRSTEKCEITLDGLPCQLDKIMLMKVLKEMAPGMEDLFLHPSLKKQGQLINGCLCPPGCVYGHPVAVDWLKAGLKQKLESAKPSMLGDGPHLQPLHRLLCQRWRLGQPLFTIKNSSMSPGSWQWFWYCVVIPNINPTCGPLLSYHHTFPETIGCGLSVFRWKIISTLTGKRTISKINFSIYVIQECTQIIILCCY
uniref:RRM domain-containing protein n=1 Tax=Leptobrachium leishanense TaxID=445787 RepID=A0A8C5PCM3_9ANUR